MDKNINDTESDEFYSYNDFLYEDIRDMDIDDVDNELIQNGIDPNEIIANVQSLLDEHNLDNTQEDTDNSISLYGFFLQFCTGRWLIPVGITAATILIYPSIQSNGENDFSAQIAELKETFEIQNRNNQNSIRELVLDS